MEGEAMTNKNYVAGRRREYRAMRILEGQGYDCVLRTAGSHGAFDVIAIGSTNIRAVQCKPDYVTPAERESLQELQVPSNVSKEIWRFITGKKDPFIEVIH
jgi:Holliday junction resolvase